MARTDKFNIHWQIVRVRAKKSKSFLEKLTLISDFLESNKNKHNYDRVMNWLKMSVHGISNHIIKDMYRDKVAEFEERKSEFQSTADTDNDLSKISTEELKRVLKDLLGRKYNFMYNGKPKSQSSFEEKLIEELIKRGVHVS